MTTLQAQRSLETRVHDDLVVRALVFAKNGLNCWVAGKDIGAAINGHHEIADVWGYTVINSHAKLRSMYGSWLFEIKATRADFLVDLKKPHRQPNADALGRWRVYYATPGIIQPDEVPVGWGLIEPRGEHYHRYLVIPKPFEVSVTALHAEIKIAARLSREWELLRSRAVDMINFDEDEKVPERTSSTGYLKYSHVIAKYETDRGQGYSW